MADLRNMMSRRLFLGRSATFSAAGIAATLPAVSEVRDNPSQLSRFTVDDDHAIRLARPGDVVFYDTADREPVHGKIFVTLTDKRQRLYLVRARNVDGLWWAERFDDSDWYGPMEFEFFRARIQGLAKAMFRPLNGGAA